MTLDWYIQRIWSIGANAIFSMYLHRLVFGFVTSFHYGMDAIRKVGYPDSYNQLLGIGEM